MNAERETGNSRLHKFFIKLTLVYFVVLCFGYSYGITVYNDVALRIPDMISIFIIVFGSCLILAAKKIKINPIVFLPIIPFLTLEIFLPIIGGGFISGLSGFTSGVRIFLLYMPLIIYFLLYGYKNIELFERKFYKLLKVIIILNLTYSFLQLLVAFNIFPEKVLFVNMLANWSVDEHFQIRDGFRASGFFVNTTSLAVFGILSMSYFFAKLNINNGNSELLFGLASLFLVIVSTSRTAYICAFLILIIYVLLNLRKSFKLILFFLIGAIFFVAFLENTIGLDLFFSRFIRLDDGFQYDYSLNYRTDIIWPYILNNLYNYPLGTLIPPTQVFGVIDSGYLTYYAQGKWVFILSIIYIYISTFLLIIKGRNYKKTSWSRIFLLYTLIFVMLAMTISNPLRSPFLIFFILLAYVYNNYERRIFQ